MHENTHVHDWFIETKILIMEFFKQQNGKCSSSKRCWGWCLQGIVLWWEQENEDTVVSTAVKKMATIFRCAQICGRKINFRMEDYRCKKWTTVLRVCGAVIWSQLLRRPMKYDCQGFPSVSAPEQMQSSAFWINTGVPCPATEEGHEGEPQSNKGWMWHLVCDTLLPTPSQSSSWRK